EHVGDPAGPRLRRPGWQLQERGAFRHGAPPALVVWSHHRHAAGEVSLSWHGEVRGFLRPRWRPPPRADPGGPGRLRPGPRRRSSRLALQLRTDDGGPVAERAQLA